MTEDIKNYHRELPADRREICDALYGIISKNLTFTENKIWHGHPVWFIEGNPIVGYSSQKAGIRLLFWSGASFDEPQLTPGTGKFKDASIIYTDTSEIAEEELVRWLEKSERIQWDYKNLVKRKGELLRLS